MSTLADASNLNCWQKTGHYTKSSRATYIKSSSAGFTPEQLLHHIAGTGSIMHGVLSPFMG